MILEIKTVLRTALRRCGLAPLAHKVRMLWHKSDYEDRFADAMLASVQPDDCVWDVGANVGFYTEQFAKLARRVVAFEPVPENCGQIECKRIPNVDCLQIALGDSAGEKVMFIGRQFSSVVVAPYPHAPRRVVKVCRADDLVDLPSPAIVKIDVEGYEVEVLRGMCRTLGGVRALFVEIHFQLLDQRGMRQAPATLVRDLKSLGFSRIEWPDASHIAAYRV